MQAPAQVSFSHLDVAYEYVRICTRTLDAKQFASILSKKVSLSHKTNGEIDGHAHGRDDVVSLFDQFIFTNTSRIQPVEVSMKNLERSKVRLILEVNEDKTNVNGKRRFNFVETTVFTFKESKKHPNTYKICLIESSVIRKDG